VLIPHLQRPTLLSQSLGLTPISSPLPLAPSPVCAHSTGVLVSLDAVEKTCCPAASQPPPTVCSVAPPNCVSTTPGTLSCPKDQYIKNGACAPCGPDGTSPGGAVPGCSALRAGGPRDWWSLPAKVWVVEFTLQLLIYCSVLAPTRPLPSVPLSDPSLQADPHGCQVQHDNRQVL
jgi:hypothetical protein